MILPQVLYIITFRRDRTNLENKTKDHILIKTNRNSSNKSY